MENKETHNPFNVKNASSYDEQKAKLAPLKDALHLCMRLMFSELPEDANVLCMGVGTGSELLYLASEFPGWQFSAVDPAVGMLKVARQRAEDAGITSRVSFHEGYLESLPDTGPFDAATSILVSHFVGESDKRSDYFAEIASRLRPAALIVNADLAGDTSTPEYQSVLGVWQKMHAYSQMPGNSKSVGRVPSVLPTQNIETILKSSGFESPTLFFQTLFIHAWFSKVSP